MTYTAKTFSQRLAAGLLFGLVGAVAQGSQPDNVALHRPYTLTPAPNYSGNTSATGTTELTDGAVATGQSLWTQRTTVGWSRTRPITITIDLGDATPIGRVTWHTAAGASGVEWPTAIYLFGSADGSRFAALGDLVALDATRGGVPPQHGYAEYTYQADVQSAPIRFIRFVADPKDPYLFVDEIQAFRATTASERAAAPDVIDTTQEFWKGHSGGIAADAVRNDLSRIRTKLATLRLSAGEQKEFQSRAASRAVASVASAKANPPSKSTLPLGGDHATLFATLGAAEHASGDPALQAWVANPWAPLLPEESPHGSIPAHLDILTMRGEQRSGAFNLRNSTENDMKLELSFQAEGVSPERIKMAPVAWTGTSEAGWLAAKILPSATSITIPAGTTLQIWVTFEAEDTSPGLHAGSIRIRQTGGVSADIPVALRVFSTRFPAHQALLVQGWDYLADPGTNGITTSNIGAVAPFLRSRGVNVAWSVRGVFDFGKFDGSGHLSTQPSTSALDHWLSRWPNAARYRVFVSAKSDIGGIPASDPRFSVAIKEWLNYWAAAVKQRGKSASDFDLELVDEPHSSAQEALNIEWSKAAKASGAGFRLWVNPTWPRPSDISRELLGLSDVVCVNLGIGATNGSGYWEWAREYSNSGRAVEVYGTDGPAKLLDPYAYYRVAAWRAHAIGAQGIGFWSFSDAGGGESSNDFASRSIDYVPYFLDSSGVNTGKHMEALAEGVRDYEYLRMLAQVASKAPAVNVRSDAKKLLDQAETAVLTSAGQINGPWTSGRDRSVADAWRFRIGTFLDGLDVSRMK